MVSGESNPPLVRSLRYLVGPKRYLVGGGFIYVCNLVFNVGEARGSGAGHVVETFVVIVEVSVAGMGGKQAA